MVKIVYSGKQEAPSQPTISDSWAGNAIGATGRHYSPSPHLVFRALALLVFLEAPLNAYADPGTGALLWQIVAAFFVGVLFQCRRFVDRLRNKK